MLALPTVVALLGAVSVSAAGSPYIVRAFISATQYRTVEYWVVGGRISHFLVFRVYRNKKIR